MARRKIDEPVKQLNAMRALTNQRRNRIMATAILNAARLRELISYDQSTGVFTNRINCGLHETPELASEAYKLAKQKYHPMAVF